MIGAMRADDTNAGLEIEGPRALRDVRRFSHEAMATVFEVHAAHPDRRYAAQAAQAAFDLADRLERELSRFLPNSDISRINQLAAGETHAGRSVRDGVPRDRPSHVRPDGRRLRRLDRDRAAVARARPRRLPGSRDEKRRADRSRRHRQGLRGRPDGRTARGVGARDGARSRGIQLGPRPRGAAGPRRVAAHPERSRRSLPGARPPLGAPDGARSVRAAARAITSWSRAPASPPEGAARPGSPCRVRTWPDPKRDATSWPRIAPAAVADALTTAFLLSSPGEIETLCARSPGVEAWVLPEPAEGQQGEPSLLHFGGPSPGYTSAVVVGTT